MAALNVADHRYMARALALAERARYTARPNPMVGCVLVRDGAVIGEGWHRRPGDAHAEVEALDAASAAAGGASGATAYVTLEPCSHHGRTPPCADALIAAGIAEVICGMQDPHPAVNGAGLSRLRDAGIGVRTGVMQAAAQRLNRGFTFRHTRGRPYVRLKIATSLDGATAMRTGESQWITGPAAREDVQRLRAMSCAIVTGVGTVLADDCSLTVRPAELGLDSQAAQLASVRPPLRVVLDSGLRTPPGAKVLAGSAPTLLCHDEAVPVPPSLLGAGCQLLAVRRGDAGLDLQAVLAYLATQQCNEILVESGPRLAGALLQAGLLDELIVYMAPSLLGDSARPLLELPLQQMADKVQLSLEDVRKVGTDWRFTAILQ